MIASFDLDLMRQLGREVRDIELGVILGTPGFNPIVRWREAFPWIALRDIHYQVLCLQVELCFGYLARQTRKDGKKLYVWTADEDRQFARMNACGVDGIVTNRPDRLVAWLAKKKPDAVILMRKVDLVKACWVRLSHFLVLVLKRFHFDSNLPADRLPICLLIP
jgi:hypothetical protein